MAEGHGDLPLSVPCGQCMGCRLERSRQWAIRCMHEGQMHEENCFITLTYDEENLPDNGQLVLSDLQKFWKRLRKKGHSFRYFACGEYGPSTERPHYHALVFGYRPQDETILSEGSHTLFESEELEKTWGLGLCSFGNLTFETASYVAGYVTKKITGPMADDHYLRVNRETGEIYHLKPPFNTMSRRPAIGTTWMQEYGQDTYKKDQVIMRGRAMKPPKAYDEMLKKSDPDLWIKTRIKRNSEQAKMRPENQDPDEHYYSSFNHYKARDKIARQRSNERDKI